MMHRWPVHDTDVLAAALNLLAGRFAFLHRHAHARTARNATLIGLASELPPPVLADLLGMHPTTAVRWANLASRDWHTYLATRTTEYRRP